ncbi:MAG: hypothetical protein IJT66_06250, partial [Clostridia bacterium]|nr:hypothetical protein [Clostridia bacterium]
VKGLYEAEYREKTWRLFGKNMPVHLHEKVFWMMRIEERILSREELENELIEQSEAYLQLEKIPQYEVKNREFDEIQDGLRLKSLILGREEIGMEEILLFSTGNH